MAKQILHIHAHLFHSRSLQQIKHLILLLFSHFNNDNLIFKFAIFQLLAICFRFS